MLRLASYAHVVMAVAVVLLLARGVVAGCCGKQTLARPLSLEAAPLIARSCASAVPTRSRPRRDRSRSSILPTLHCCLPCTTACTIEHTRKNVGRATVTCHLSGANGRRTQMLIPFLIESKARGSRQGRLHGALLHLKQLLSHQTSKLTRQALP
jgi:hypothetical protein